MTHLVYIAAAYAATAIVLMGMIVWTLSDLQAQKRKLGRLEAEGKRRRSDASR